MIHFFPIICKIQIHLFHEYPPFYKKFLFYYTFWLLFSSIKTEEAAKEEFAKQDLSNDSVKIVNYTKHNDINETLYKEGKEEILEAIEKAQAPVIEGIYTLDNIEDFNIYEAEKLKTGFNAIDDKIIGMVFGSLNIFTGRNGAGKSTILNQMYLGEAIRQGYKCFIKY